MARSLVKILRLARQAAKFALDEDEGYDRLRFLALEEGIFQSVAKDNHITAFEKRPLFSNPKQSSAIENFQIRYTDYDQRWHLYWKRLSGKWWPYIGKNEVKTVEDCLREVEVDDSGCFWG